MKTLKVTLVNLGRVSLFNQAITPPVGLLYLAAYARRTLPLNFTIIDQRTTKTGLSNNEVVRRIERSSPDVVGFRCLTADAGLLGSVSSATRAALPNAVLVAGGPHASCVGEILLESTPLDIVVRGEGEIAFEMILRAVAERSEVSHIPGLIWRNAANEIVVNEGITPIAEDLDDIPPPAYDLLDMHPYWHQKSMGFRARRRYASLFTSRGCPYRCTYCHSIFGKRFRGQSVRRIAEDIAFLKKVCGVNDFSILDDIFNLDEKRVLDLPDELRRNGLKPELAFTNAMRTDILTPDTVEALMQSGMYLSGFALESGSPRIQKMIGKNLNIDRYLAGVEMVTKRRVFTFGLAMLGFPTETVEEMRQTVDVICGTKLHATFFFVVTPFPNTRLFDQVAEISPEKLRNVDYETGGYYYNLTSNVSRASNEELLAVKREANRRFFLNPMRVARIIRDFPKRWQLMYFLPDILELTTKKAMR